MLKQSFLAIVSLLIALLVSNFHLTNSSPVLIPNQYQQHGHSGSVPHLTNHSSEINVNNQHPEPVPHLTNHLTDLNANQDSEDEDKCTLCFKNNFSEECYFNCDKSSTKFPKGHLYCEECVLKVAKRTAKCPMCSASKDQTKINEIPAKLRQKEWEKHLEKVERLGIILPQEFNPNGVVIPVITDVNGILNDLFILVLAGIPLKHDVIIQNKIRNAIHDIGPKIKNSGNGIFTQHCIHKCMTYSNRVILSDIFKKLIESSRRRVMIHQTIKNIYELEKNPLIETLVMILSKKDRFEVLSLCGKYAVTHDHYSRLFKMIRIVYPNNKDKDYKTQMHEILTECRIDVTDILTDEEKHQFNSH